LAKFEPQFLLSGNLTYSNKRYLRLLKDDTDELERKLKALSRWRTNA
jgi:hypothetical protein